MNPDETTKTNSADQSLQDIVRKDKSKCDHIGFFTPLGCEVFPTKDNKFVFATAVLCMMCGIQFTDINALQLTKKTDSEILRP